jgi:hypothetical protein
MEEQIHNELPRGIRTLSGGSRGKLGGKHRPWQPAMAVDEQCELATRPQEPFDFDMIEGWGVRPNLFTPLNFHWLIIHEGCQDTADIYRLGGAKFQAVLDFASSQALEKRAPMRLTVHIGALAGQNQPHLHFHLLSPKQGDCDSIPTELRVLFSDDDVWLFDRLGFSACVGGLRAGECFIFPILPTLDVTHLGSTVGRVVEVYARAFKSDQGMSPDYQMSFHFNSKGEFMYGVYRPILNHWGATEYDALYTGSELILPWPHVVTAEHVRGVLEESPPPGS